MRFVIVSLLCFWIAAMQTMAVDDAAPADRDAFQKGASTLQKGTTEKTPEHQIVIQSERVTFENLASVSFQIDIRNISEKKLPAPELYWALAVVWDGKRYPRDPQHIGIWNGPAEILPRTSWRSSFSLSEYQVPPKALTDGRHTIALESDTAKSNTLVVFVDKPK